MMILRPILNPQIGIYIYVYFHARATRTRARRIFPLKGPQHAAAGRSSGRRRPSVLGADAKKAICVDFKRQLHLEYTAQKIYQKYKNRGLL